MRASLVLAALVAVIVGCVAGQGSVYAADAPRARPGDVAASTSRIDQRAAHTLQDEFRIIAGDRIFFADGSVEIGSRARAVLARQADWLKLNPQLLIAVEGHADDSTTIDDMKQLSQSRALSVRDRLIAQGVEAERITVVVKSNSDLIATCAMAACKAQNRRAITSISGRTVQAPGAVQPRPAQPNAVQR